MSRLVEFPLSEGGSVLVQVSGSNGEDVVTRGWREDRQQGVSERAQETFESAVTKVRPAADALLSSLVGLTHTPQEMTVEFAVELSAQAGAYIATLGSTANFKVTLTWRPAEGDLPHR